MSTPAEEEALERACSIWFRPPPGRAENELRALTKEERERVWADLSGSNEISNFEIPIEDAAHIQRCFQSLRGEILNFATNNPDKPLSVAYRKAPSYIESKGFMLKFLRAMDYSVPSTMALLCRHFEIKKQLFGADKLARDIVLSDLGGGDLSYLETGAYQYFESTDRGGRAIAFFSFPDSYNVERLNVLRVVFYLNMAVSDDEHVQRLGTVRVGYFHQNSYPRGGPDHELMRQAVEIMSSLPIRLVAYYIVSGSSLWSHTAEVMLLLMSPFQRVRTRILNGSYYENLYALISLGIPQEAFPAREDGSLTTTSIQQWVTVRRQFEHGR